MRLNAINQLPGFFYQASYIISEMVELDQYKSSICEDYGFRRSTTYYLKNFNIDYTKQVHNHGSECLYSEKRISLDRYCFENRISNVDFIKIDTDGADYAVLRGAEKLLQEGDVLGVYVECQFLGEDHPCANTFRNIDRFLVAKGFSLFDLSAWRYTKAQLPGRFLYKSPSHTTTGQISWGDALYLKDFVYMKSQGKQVSNSQIIKMACVQEIFGLPDCAAELLVTFREQLCKVVDVEKCLDALACDMNIFPDYNTHINQFFTDREAFFPK